MCPSSSSSGSDPAALRRRELHARDESTEIPVALARAHENGEAPALPGAQGLGLRARAQHRELSADDGFESRLLRREMKPRGAVQPVAIEQGERRIAQRRRARDKRLGQRRAIEKRERRRSMQLNVHGVRRFERFIRFSPGCPRETIDSSRDRDKSGTRRRAARRPTRRYSIFTAAVPPPVAATTRHGPVVPFEDSGALQGPAQSSRGRQRVRHAHRASALDRDARGNGKAEPTKIAIWRVGDSVIWRVENRACFEASRKPHTKSPSRTRPARANRRAPARRPVRLAHQRLQACDERRERFGRRQRPLEQRVLDDASRRRFDVDGHPVDAAIDSGALLAAPAIGCDSSWSRSSVRRVRASRIGAGSSSRRVTRSRVTA